MEPALKPFKFNHDEKGILYPNFCQHYHIGFNKYLLLKNEQFKDVY